MREADVRLHYCKRHNYSDPDSKRFDPDLDYYVRVCVNCGEMEE